MHIHIMGICGTFMGGLALLARAQGHQVSGSDTQVYPPMSTQLAEQAITLYEGYGAENLADQPDLVLVGNALSRGNPEVEALLNAGLPYCSGPEWLGRYVLPGRHVLAVAGTHGKTTTTSLLAWILDVAGLEPGFLVGGVPNNFGVSARLGEGACFVVEADEYDSAFFDKRSKFVHYRPRTAILNNLEYDHADIFPDLAAIQRQFHHFVRTIPGAGRIIVPTQEAALHEMLAMGCWSEVTTTAVAAAADWQAYLTHPDGSVFSVSCAGRRLGEVRWTLTGLHNVANALSALAAAAHVGVAPQQALAALASFQSVKRRMEVIWQTPALTVYDDFAHHPTAIASTLAGLRERVGGARIVAVVEPRSNTMRLGVHAKTLVPALAQADVALIFDASGAGQWQITPAHEARVRVCTDFETLFATLCEQLTLGGHVVMMSNGDFSGLAKRLRQRLQ
ncbi:MAG: UDP-N-acetylmuramate:L-alanyl-gamma-D-glutamyl-meso-diaminopimelate ligase [Methylococcales bacterium]|nr:UDP-N-acetylmuramate:L-alanyl-gamma-D-glutamyl-meso-diaminopimelate ligase [Methylococcales bacterium]